MSETGTAGSGREGPPAASASGMRKVDSDGEVKPTWQ